MKPRFTLPHPATPQAKDQAIVVPPVPVADSAPAKPVSVYVLSAVQVARTPALPTENAGIKRVFIMAMIQPISSIKQKRERLRHGLSKNGYYYYYYYCSYYYDNYYLAARTCSCENSELGESVGGEGWVRTRVVSGLYFGTPLSSSTAT